MTRPRHPKTDRNQKAIVDAINKLDDFEAYGAISKLSDAECPGDVLVLCKPQKRWQVFEIKKPKGAQISVAQLRRRDVVPIVYYVDDILRWFGY